MFRRDVHDNSTPVYYSGIGDWTSLYRRNLFGFYFDERAFFLL